MDKLPMRRVVHYWILFEEVSIIDENDTLLDVASYFNIDVKLA